jgi:hypothetical protein
MWSRRTFATVAYGSFLHSLLTSRLSIPAPAKTAVAVIDPSGSYIAFSVPFDSINHKILHFQTAIETITTLEPLQIHQVISSL